MAESEQIEPTSAQTVLAKRGGKTGFKRFRPEPKCKTCQFSVAHKKFHEDLLNSTYFDQNSVEGIPQIVKRWKVQKSLGYRNVMTHVARHLAPVKRYNDEKALEIVTQEERQPLPVNLQIEDGETAYVRALDDVISEFHTKVKEGKIKLTAQSGLQAIKIKADIETKNKDRKLDFLKAFSAMGQKKQNDEE